MSLSGFACVLDVFVLFVFAVACVSDVFVFFVFAVLQKVGNGSKEKERGGGKKEKGRGRKETPGIYQDKFKFCIAQCMIFKSIKILYP